MAQLLSSTIYGLLSVAGNLLAGGVAPTGLKTINLVVYTSGTSLTYTPTTNTRGVFVICTGGGGGGGGADTNASVGAGGGGGGGAGGTTMAFLNATELGANAVYSVGGGGTAGSTSGGGGGTGGTTTFNPAGTGATLTANGGTGGTGTALLTADAVDAGGGGGAASNGTINFSGSTGGDAFGVRPTSGNIAVGGKGGSSFWGGAGRHSARITNGSTAASSDGAFGTGGSGACVINTTTGAAGGTGEGGCILIVEFIN